MAAGSLPIYYGAPNINAFLPCSSPCILNANDYENEEALAAHVLELDKDPAGTLSACPASGPFEPFSRSAENIGACLSFHPVRQPILPALPSCPKVLQFQTAAYPRGLVQLTGRISSGKRKNRVLNSWSCDICAPKRSFAERALKYEGDDRNECIQ